MPLPRRRPDRPPRAVAGPSIGPVVIRLSAVASPEDWQLRSGDAARDADREWSLPDHYGLTTFGWCADPHLPRVDVWRSSASAYVGARLSGGPLAGRLSCKRPRPPWCRSGYQRYASGCLETAICWAFAASGASVA